MLYVAFAIFLKLATKWARVSNQFYVLENYFFVINYKKLVILILGYN
jgi:hypothetical protein